MLFNIGIDYIVVCLLLCSNPIAPCAISADFKLKPASFPLKRDKSGKLMGRNPNNPFSYTAEIKPLQTGVYTAGAALTAQNLLEAEETEEVKDPIQQSINELVGPTPPASPEVVEDQIEVLENTKEDVDTVIDRAAQLFTEDALDQPETIDIPFEQKKQGEFSEPAEEPQKRTRGFFNSPEFLSAVRNIGKALVVGGLAAATAKLKAQGRMGGGMMKKYSVGGGLDMGGPKGKIMQSIKNKKKNSERLTRRDKQFLEDNAKGIPTKAYMGGGMMKKYSTGGDSKLKDDTFKPIFKKSEGAKKELAFEQIDSALSQKNIGSGGMSRRGLMKVVDAAADDKQLERSLRKRLRDAPTKENKKMGGGMMNKPMGYKSGKSIKVKCKLGKNKPTKLY